MLLSSSLETKVGNPPRPYNRKSAKDLESRTEETSLGRLPETGKEHKDQENLVGEGV